MSRTNCSRILVVDDIADAADSMAMLLGMWGYDAKVSYKGVAALATARTFRPEVVLLDIGMPRMDGFQVAQRLRELPGLRNMVIVAISGYADEANRNRARLIGFDHYLGKPVDLDDLRALLDRVPARLSVKRPVRVRELQEAVS
jgi:CheY-like chemotaxis protein